MSFKSRSDKFVHASASCFCLSKSRSHCFWVLVIGVTSPPSPLLSWQVLQLFLNKCFPLRGLPPSAPKAVLATNATRVIMNSNFFIVLYSLFLFVIYSRSACLLKKLMFYNGTQL